MLLPQISSYLFPPPPGLSLNSTSSVRPSLTTLHYTVLVFIFSLALLTPKHNTHALLLSLSCLLRVLPIECTGRASLLAQWLRICLPMQGTWVQALVREDPTCRGAAKSVRHSYWACALEPTRHNYWARAPQLLKPTCLEPMLRNKRSHRNEKPAHGNEAHAATKTWHSQ